MPRKPSKKKQKRKAKQEVESLLGQAIGLFKRAPGKAHDLVRKARRAAMKVQLPLKKEVKRRFCKHCYHLMVPGQNCRVRVHKSRVIIYCLDCKKYTRIPLKH